MNRKIILTILALIMIAPLLAGWSDCSLQAQELYQSGSWNRAVGTSRDTVILPGKWHSVKKGAVTNDDIAFPLYVYFSYPGSIRLDSTSKVEVPPGVTLYFATTGRAIFRVSSENSGMKISQAFIGRNFSLGGAKQSAVSYGGRNFTNAIIVNFDLTGSNFAACNFTGAIISNCILKDCDFTAATGVTNEYLSNAAIYLPDGSGYDFTGTAGDTVSKE